MLRRGTGDGLLERLWDALPVALDIGDRASIETALAAVRDGLGSVKHLVNNAATWAVKSFADHTPAEIDRVIGITLTERGDRAGPAR